jgi:hypothetical protein
MRYALSLLSRYVIFLARHSNIMPSLSHPTSNYVEFIGGETANTYLQTFIAQPNHGSRGTSHTVKSRCACVWDIWYGVDKW